VLLLWSDPLRLTTLVHAFWPRVLIVDESGVNEQHTMLDAPIYERALQRFMQRLPGGSLNAATARCNEGIGLPELCDGADLARFFDRAMRTEIQEARTRSAQ
jgi:hypothetical protein